MYLRNSNRVVDVLCKEYYRGRKEVAGVIINIFEPLLRGIKEIVLYGRPKYGPVYRTFLNAFKKSKNEKYDEVARYIHIHLNRYDKGDIEQEMYISLLEAARKAGQKERIITSYIITTFIYEYARRLKEMINTVAQRKVKLEENIEQIGDTPVEEEEDAAAIIEEYDPKQSLTDGERKILSYHIEGYSDLDIAEETALPLRKIRKIRRRAVDKLRRQLST